jgi:purine-binding chemotaxis protein CheW
MKRVKNAQVRQTGLKFLPANPFFLLGPGPFPMSNSLRLVTFGAGHQLFGIDIRWVREILRAPQLTPVDGAPAVIRGLVNLRGQILTGYDLAVIAGTAPATVGESWCVVLKCAPELERMADTPPDADQAPRELSGLFVNRIGDIVEIDPAALAPAPRGEGALNESCVAGVIPRTEGLLIVLRGSGLVAAEAVA